jgi:hypothetical protein
MSSSLNFSIYNTTDSGAEGRSHEGVAVSGALTFYSSKIGGRDSDGCALHLQWTGTPTGTFTLWMSDKPYPSETDDSDWVQDTGFSPTNPAGAAGKMRDDMSNAKARWKRVKYVNSASTGTLFGWASVSKLA